jgi:hypothetical protein
MRARVRRIIFWLWPPCEASFADRQIARRNLEAGNNARWDALLTQIRSALPSDAAKYAELELLAKHIGDTESKRKDTLENKAATYVIGIGIGISILSIVPTLFSDKWLIPAMSAYTATAAYLTAIICLLVAAYYSIRVRQVAGIASPSADSFLDLVKVHQGRVEERIVLIIANSKWNEDLLLQKSNYLSVAEKLFLRGLSLLAFAAIISVASKFI